MTQDELILVLYEHRIFGWKFAVFSAEETESGSMRILGTPEAVAESRRGTPSELVRLIRLVNDTTDSALMKAYSKKKSLTEFHKEVTPEMLERYIRPRMETANHKITLLARQTRIPVYLRTDLSNNTLFVQNEIEVLLSPTSCLFNFVKDSEGLRYFITLTNEGREISLQTTRAVILSDKPAVVLLGKEIHSVVNIEGRKLTPFFSKDYITVPPASEKIYIRNFIAKTLPEYDVRVEGIPVNHIHSPKEAILSLEKDLNQEYVLLLSFRYNQQKEFQLDTPVRKIVETIEEGEDVSLEWYERDIEWETRLLQDLLNEGLERKGSGSLHLSGTEGDSYQLIEWLNRKHDILAGKFRLEQNIEQPFFTGSLRKETTLEEKIDWFEVNIQVVAGGFTIPFSRFRKYILEGRREYVLPDKMVLVLPEEWFEKYTDLFRFSKDKENRLEIKKIHTPVVAQALLGDIPGEKQERLKDILEVPAERPPLPVQSRTTLRPYQREGFYWLWHLYRLGYGACLADDMGLGKTLQTITLLQYIYTQAKEKKKDEAKPEGQLSFFEVFRPSLPATLVVAPTSLLHNWKNELKRFAPELRVFLYAGANRMRSKDIGKIFDRFEVVITSYGTMRNDIEFLSGYTFQMLILDESQYIKNPSSVSYQAVKQLQSAHRLVLTGTPIENSLDDLWAQFNFINEGLLGSHNSFRKEFIHKIIKEKNVLREELLRKIINPFMLRRTKEEVTPELPPLLQEVVYCDMTDAQQEIYESEKNRIRNVLLQAKENPEQTPNTFIALEGLNKLRQLANHPRMANTAYEGDSGKFEQIILFFENLKASGHKVLIFSSYVKHLNLLAGKFDKERWKYAMLTGETQYREEEINRFTHDPDIHCFFISLKAGSTGLNLTAADYVFIIDPWWNPAAEMQALARAHRIGQDKPVIAYRFISSETVEEKILHLQESKTELFDTFVRDSNPLANLNWQELESLLDN